MKTKVLKNKINKKNEEKNLNNLFQITMNEYKHTFERSNKLESKISILLAFEIVYTSIIVNFFKFDFVYKKQEIVYKRLLFINNLLNLTSYVLVILSILFFLFVLISMKMNTIDTNNLYSERIPTLTENEYMKYVIYKYNVAIIFNNNGVSKKYKKYDLAVFFLLLSVALLSVSFIIYNIFVLG